MLRISRRSEDGQRMTLELEGKLDQARVALLEAECEELIAAGAGVEIDLACLRFADTAGVQSLTRLRARGVRLVGATPLVERLLS